MADTATTETTTSVPPYVYVSYIRASSQQVWRALTDAELTARSWGHANVSDWQPGSQWEHRRVDGSGTADVTGTVLEVDPPTRLVITFKDSEQDRPSGPSVVTFLIEPHDDIVRLTVTHENLPNTDMLNGISRGWPAVLANLKSLLETGDVLPTTPWEMPEEPRMNIDTFGRAADYARSVLAELTHDDLKRPTPCDGWDADRVVLHLADVIDGLGGLLETGKLALPQPPRIDDPDPVAVVYERLAQLTHALAAADNVSRVGHAALAGAIELTTHGWDIGVALDPARRIPESLARDVLELVSPILTIDGRGEDFAPPVDPPTRRLRKRSPGRIPGPSNWSLTTSRTG